MKDFGFCVSGFEDLVLMFARGKVNDDARVPHQVIFPVHPHPVPEPAHAPQLSNAFDQFANWSNIRFIDYKTSMTTDEDPLRGLLFCKDLGFSLTLHVLEERRRRCERPAHAPQPSNAFDQFQSICQSTHSDWSNTVMAGATVGLPADGDLINPCS